MPKQAIGINVLEAAQKRIEWTFDNYERIYVSFSGGKDSTVMLHLVMSEAIKRKRKVGVMFIDLEGQYKMTIDLVHKCFDIYKQHIEPHWVCLPIHLRNAVSVYDPFWVCWDSEEEENWVRQKPKNCIDEEDFFPFFRDGMEFEEFVPEFGDWFGNGKKCACFVGIRSDESLNRYRTITSKNKRCVCGLGWTTCVTDLCDNIYPIYDWRTEDIWTYHGKNPDKPSNKLYELMYKAGLTIHQARICQPYGDDQRRGLWLFHLIEPETWSRVVARVNGANSGALYVNETGNMTGYRKINKPDGHNWESFAELLVNSMPPSTCEHYKNKIAKFCLWWQERGYEDGIPDEGDLRLEQDRKIPSWRRVCKSLLRNDFWCKGLSFTQTKSDAYKKYLELMKNKRKEMGVLGMLFENCEKGKSNGYK